jgi:hypothetical protein
MWETLPEDVAWFVQQLESSGFMEAHRAGGTTGSRSTSRTAAFA